MTHCGFGGTLEFIHCGIPIACFPHFGDQIINADLLCNFGAAIYLPKNKIKLGPPKYILETPLFDEKDVT
jgi:UDP:flavonoid glycosyltransferase YjiC (YdhE family)